MLEQVAIVAGKFHSQAVGTKTETMLDHLAVALGMRHP